MYRPLDLWGFFLSFFFFFCLGLFFRGNPAWLEFPHLVCSFDPRHRLLIWPCSASVPGCSCNVRIITQNTVLEASRLWFMLFSFISLHVGENGVTKCTPRVWQFKEKIHPHIVIRCLISSICAVHFDGKVLWLSQSQENARIVYIWPVIRGKNNNY